MTTMDASRNPLPDEDWLEQALRRQAETLPAWLADEGFSDRVMQRLPPVRRRRGMAWWPAVGAMCGLGLMLSLDQRWRLVPALFTHIDHPGVVMALALMLVPMLLTSVVLLLLNPYGD
ncbi:hypothetical protein ACYJW8_11975 [Frateuria aurantia]